MTTLRIVSFAISLSLLFPLNTFAHDCECKCRCDSEIIDTNDEVLEPSSTEIVLSFQEVDEAFDSFPALLKQARAVPYFRSGEILGMRLFSIDKGSLYEKAGLLNGDILRSVNGKSLVDPTDALSFLSILRQKKNVALGVERLGKELTLNVIVREQ